MPENYDVIVNGCWNDEMWYYLVIAMYARSMMICKKSLGGRKNWTLVDTFSEFCE